jgi:hypothetical protein
MSETYEHPDKHSCNMCLKKTDETMGTKACNIRVQPLQHKPSRSNIHIKHLQHTYEIFEILETYVCYVRFLLVLPDDAWQSGELRHVHPHDKPACRVAGPDEAAISILKNQITVACEAEGGIPSDLAVTVCRPEDNLHGVSVRAIGSLVPCGDGVDPKDEGVAWGRQALDK